MEEEVFAKLLLAEYIVCILAQFLTLILFALLLLDKSESCVQWFPMLYVFMSCGALFPIGAITYLGYLIIFWSPVRVQYDSDVMYITGIVHTCFLLSFPFLVLFLIADRIVFNLWQAYGFTYQLAFAMLGISCSIFLASVVVIVEFLPRIRSHFKTTCRSLACLFSNSDTYQTIRFIIAVIVAFLTIAFYFVAKQKMNANDLPVARTNRLIFQTLLIAIIFDTIPSCFIFLGIKYYRDVLQQMGSYSTVLGSLMAMFCAILHWQTIRGCKMSFFNRTSPLNSQAQVIQREIV